MRPVCILTRLSTFSHPPLTPALTLASKPDNTHFQTSLQVAHYLKSTIVNL